MWTIAPRDAAGDEREPLEMLDELLDTLSHGRPSSLAYTPAQAARARQSLTDMRRLLAATTPASMPPPGTVDNYDY